VRSVLTWLVVLISGASAIACRAVPSTPVTRSSQAAPTLAAPLASLEARPLLIEREAPNLPCPVSAAHQLPLGPAIGDGPVYILGQGEVSLGAVGTRRHGAYVLPSTWVETGPSNGPILVRGRRIDASGDVRFGMAPATSTRELVVTASTTVGARSSPGSRRWTAYLELPAPGCYGLQADGATFGEIITILARR
jgi:hypothetical protein